MTDLTRIIEAILFVAEEPVSAEELAHIANQPLTLVSDSLSELGDELTANHGIVLRNVAGGWRLYTEASVLPYLETYAASDRAKKLTNASMETLAVVAYKQPVSRGQVTEIRGVDSERALKNLERRGLIGEIGTAAGPGQAILYGTTPLFLEKMGVASISDLPPLADHVPPAEIVETLEMPMRPESSSNDSTN
ncbi:MAG: SMC-Scp complex subunit ScpB [Actinomycetota bacterium]|nr:SMC-Scp complex subunit ScpB [Actinomycetota bacterium]